MSDKEEVKLAKDKEAIASMRAAKNNMTTALDRITVLEIALKRCAGKLEDASKMLSGHVYDSRVPLKDAFLEEVNRANNIL
jgi:hypothetical protein